MSALRDSLRQERLLHGYASASVLIPTDHWGFVLYDIEHNQFLGNMMMVRSVLEDLYGNGNYHIAPDGKISIYGKMPNSNEIGWYHDGWVDDPKTVARYEKRGGWQYFSYGGSREFGYACASRRRRRRIRA